MTKSASSTYVEFGFESTFGGGVASPPMLFGKEVKATGYEFKNNQQPFGQLYTPEIESYGYGKNEGKVSVEYVLSNPWFLNSIFGTVVSVDIDAGGGGLLFSHTWSSNPAVDATIRDVNSMALRVGFDVTTDYVRLPVGVICPSLSMKMALNEPIKITQELIWGEETVNETFATPTGAILPGEAPYMFVNARITSPLTGATLATVQTFDLNMNSNAELVYEFFDEKSVGSFRKILEFTGKIGVTVKDSAFFSEVLGRAESANDLVVFITNKAAGDAERSIELTFEGASFSVHNTTGIEPGELVIENIDFQCRRCTAVAKNEATAIPT